VVHGKGALLNKMPGDRWQKFANLRAYYGFMFGHPGKKLLFMGGEWGQEREWSHERSLDWELLETPEHAGLQRLVRDLNRVYRETPALHQLDFESAGFEWIDHEDAERSLLSFVRHGRGDAAPVLVVCNFTPAVHRGVRLGVPRAGPWREVINTDSHHYGGSDVGTPLGAAAAQPVPSHGQGQSVVLDVPPLATVMLQWQGDR
jgi:1,4-alpha-glucan branching enzyme